MSGAGPGRDDDVPPDDDPFADDEDVVVVTDIEVRGLVMTDAEIAEAFGLPPPR